jgi:hypothetical protein
MIWDSKCYKMDENFMKSALKYICATVIGEPLINKSVVGSLENNPETTMGQNSSRGYFLILLLSIF